jgi:hypothetical protein
VNDPHSVFGSAAHFNCGPMRSRVWNTFWPTAETNDYNTRTGDMVMDIGDRIIDIGDRVMDTGDKAT